MRTIKTLLLAAIALILTGTDAQAGPINRVVNGDFETLASGNTLGTQGGYFCRQGSTCVSNVANWSSTCQGTSCGTGGTPDSILFANTSGAAFNGNIGLWAMGQNGLTSNSPVPNSPTGGNFVAFDGAPQYNASISQVITGLTPGYTYILTFSQGAAQQNGMTGATTEWWRVSLGTHTRDSQVMNNVSHGWVPWQQQTMQFFVPLTSTGTETLTFLSMGTPNNLPPIALLDGVSLTDAPEPQTYALVGLALAAIPLARRRQRKP